MKYLLQIKEEANIDLIEAYDYYESKRIGLGDRFLEKVDLFLELILKNPYLFPSKQSSFREAFIVDFPYLIIYGIEDNIIVVFAFFNTWKSPKGKPH